MLEIFWMLSNGCQASCSCSYWSGEDVDSLVFVLRVSAFGSLKVSKVAVEYDGLRVKNLLK